MTVERMADSPAGKSVGRFELPAGKCLPSWSVGSAATPTSAAGIARRDLCATLRVSVQLRSEQWAVPTRLRRVTSSSSHFPAGKCRLFAAFGAQSSRLEPLARHQPAVELGTFGWSPSAKRRGSL